MTTTNLDPSKLVPRNGTMPQIVANLAEEMRENGWDGRPLLVLRYADRLQALTGSHRIAAAIGAELPTVPCVVLDARKAPDWLEAVECAVMDFELLAAFKRARLALAVRLMQQEIRSL